MIDVSSNLGVQSYCYRGFKSLDDVVRLMKQSGLTAIELWGGHCDWKAPEQFGSVIATLKDAGVAIPAIGVNRFANDPGAERNYLEFCKASGAGVISANFPMDSVPESLRAAERLADEYDVKIAVHNHGGHHWLGSEEALRWLFARTSPRIGLCLDTAWALDARLDPVKAVEVFAERLYGLHLKDFRYRPDRTPEDVIVGSGNLDLKGLFEALRAIDYEGYAVLEYEGDVDNPEPALTKCVEAVRAAWA